MLSHLLRAPFPPGYGDALLPIAQCKAQAAIEQDDADALIQELRDSAIDAVERHVRMSLGPTSGNVWECEVPPVRRTAAIDLKLKPITAITALGWIDRGGNEVAGAITDYRLGAGNMLYPRAGIAWPVDIGGGLRITFSAGFAPGACPKALLHAARLMFGHLWRHRDEALDEAASGNNDALPRSVLGLCRPFKKMTA